MNVLQPIWISWEVYPNRLWITLCFTIRVTTAIVGSHPVSNSAPYPMAISYAWIFWNGIYYAISILIMTQLLYYLTGCGFFFCAEHTV